MRFGKSVWYSNRISENNAEIAEYAEPVEVVTRPNYFTVMKSTSRGYLSIMQFGENAENTWTAVANGISFGDRIKAGDVMWLDGESPIETVEKTYGNGASATAVVKSVDEVNYTISITLERNQNQVKE